jgi:uncharacterized protein (TIGR03000 family)
MIREEETMILHRLPKFAYAALTVAALAFGSGPAWAQKGGGHGGGHSGGEHHGGGEQWGGGGWGGGYGGYGYGGYGWGGYGYYPYGAFGRGLFWGGYPYGYYGRGYYGSYPYDYGYYNYGPDYSYSVPSQPAPANAPRMNIPENAALIDVRVPDNAQVWIDDQQTKQTGPMREFVTPALDPGQEFNYDVRARWTENGQQVDRHRKVTFHAGDRLMVNLMAPQGSPSAEARQ